MFFLSLFLGVTLARHSNIGQWRSSWKEFLLASGAVWIKWRCNVLLFDEWRQMMGMKGCCLGVALVVLSSVVCVTDAVDCYTCNVDFRNQKFDQNNSCLFPTKENERTTCSAVSRYCQGVITRINGVFVQLQRTCETDCQETCTEKGYGIETRECKFCCMKSADCGREGYKTSAGVRLAVWDAAPIRLLMMMMVMVMWTL